MSEQNCSIRTGVSKNIRNTLLLSRLSDKSCPRRKPLFRGRARHVARYGGGYRHGLYNGPIYDSCPGYGAGYSYGYGGCPGYGGVVGGLIGGVLGGYRPF